MIIPPPNRHSKTKARAKARARAKTKSKPSSKPQACPRPPSKSRPSAEPQTDATAPAAKEQLASALQLLHEIMQASGEQILLDPEVRPTAKMVYTNGVVLWMLIVQRLAGGKTLEEIVSQILTHDRQLLPDNKRVRENTLSENSAAYSQARKRLSLETLAAFSECVCNYLGEISGPVIGSQRVFILDGTTLTLPPTPALKKAYPPALNQYGESVWPVAMLMVAHELQSGCACCHRSILCMVRTMSARPCRLSGLSKNCRPIRS